MRSWRRVRLGLAGVCGVLALLGVCVPVASAAPGPWWHVSVGARPTYVGAPHGEVQEVSVTPVAGYGTLATLQVKGANVACLGSGAYGGYCEGAFGLPEVETAGQLQSALEGVYGAGKVEVSGGGTGFSEPLMVSTTPGRVVLPLEVGQVEAGKLATSVVQEAISGHILIEAVNVGDAPVDGSVSPVVVSDTLPKGLYPVKMGGSTAVSGYPEAGTAPGLSCDVATVTCTYTGTIEPYHRLEIAIAVIRSGAAKSGAVDEASVSGGGARPVSATDALTVSEEAVPFGVEAYEMLPEAEGGQPFTQAGGHPFQLTTVLRLNQTGSSPFQPAQPRNLTFDLPAGLVANATATRQCSYAVFATLTENFTNACPADTAVGVATAGVELYRPPEDTYNDPAVPVFNLTPAPGEPARFGFIVAHVPVVVNTYLRVGDDYAATASVANLTQSGGDLTSVMTLWGVPGEAVHDTARGWRCLEAGEEEGCGPKLGAQTPFLQMPSSCRAPLQTPMILQSWLPGALPLEPVRSAYAGPVVGCNQERFQPQISVEPSTVAAASPAGVDVKLGLPQQTSEIPGGVAEADVRSATVTLPAGLQLNPAAAAGLGSCTEKDIGYEAALSAQAEHAVYSEESEAERNGSAEGLKFDGGRHRTGCPEDSKLGTVRVRSPLLEEGHELLEGAVYQASEYQNPFGSLLALYVVAQAPKSGVRVRLAGEVKVLPGGQIVSSFPNTPQLPFEDFELDFFEGGKAPLATGGCGAYKTTSSIASWAGGTVSPFSEFDVNQGCAGLGGFAPAFEAGGTSPAAGAFTTFAMRMSRKDGEQALSTVNMTMPKGMAGMVANVPQCPSAVANADAWRCPAASKVGHVIVHAGVGSEPVALPEAGRPQDPVYLTGPYAGAPFGLAIVVPAEAGPFNLDEGGHPVVVRAKIMIDPITAQVSIVSTPMPTALHNINLDIRSVETIVDNPRFMFNPTSCESQSITGAIASVNGAAESVASHFQAAGCAALKFEPKFSVLVHAHHTRKNGAYFHAVMKSTAGQANIGKVDVQLPKALAVRDSTLKEACPEAQYAVNPAGCPANSFVGHARVKTPILAKALTGPAIFVSHAGKEFPNLDLVLQGEGVTIELTSNTYVGKKGLTFSRFETVPDAPFSRFDLVLPAGPYSALAGNGSFCKHKLQMPTKIAGQNGALIEEKTKLKVTGCGPRFFVRKVHTHGDKATIVIHAPYAGRLTANGKGISKATKRITKHGGRLAVTVKLKHHFIKKLRHHRHRHHIKVNVHLRFKAHHHKTLKAKVKVKLH